MKRYLLGIDVGTTGVKALLVDSTGRVVAGSIERHEMRTPRPLWVEQEPEDWWKGAVASIWTVMRKAKVDSEQIVGVGLTGQMHGLVLLDSEGKVLRPCILWNDQRSAPQCDAMTERIGKERLIALTGNVLLPGFTAPKIEWVRQNEPKVFRRARRLLLPKDFIRFKLTGEYKSDVADASGTLLMDVKNRRWSDEMIEELRIPYEWLPEVTESVEVSASVSVKGSRSTGLKERTPVVGGAGDQAAQAVGSGTVRDGMTSITIGTSGVVFAASERYAFERDGRLHAFCHAVPGRWHLMGVMLSAGGSLKWLSDTFGKSSYDRLTSDASKVPAGSEGLIFLPYLSGERTPHPDPHARGVLLGLSHRHTRAHITRSVIEGVTFGLRDMLELVRACDIKASEVRASGGGAKSKLWLQVLADTFDCGVAKLRVDQGAAYGGALLAGVGVDMFGSVDEACDRCVRVASHVRPGKDAKVYERYYERFRALYPLLREEFAALSALEDAHRNGAR